MAASFQRPRATHGTDILIDPTPSQLDALVERLAAAGFYVDSHRAREALKERRQFNVIETAQACKIDLLIRRDRPFSREESTRRLTVELFPGR